MSRVLLCLCVGLALVGSSLAASASVLGSGAVHASSSETTATFGKTSVGASSEQFAANRKRVNRYALPTAGSVTKLSIYLAPTGHSGAQAIEGVLYADSAGKPGALLGTTNPITFSSTQAAGWYDLTFPSPVSLTAGNYWIGVLTGTTADVAGYRYDSVSASRDYNSNTYTSGPSNPFGSVTSDNQQTSLYATYTPSAPPASVPENTELPTISGTAQVGQTLSASTGKWSENPTAYEYHWQRCEADGENCTPIEGATNQTYTVAHADLNLTLRVSVTAINADGPSKAAVSAQTGLVQPAPSTATFGKTSVGASSEQFAANRKRVNRYALPTAGSVTKLSIYLAPTGTSGAQAIEGVLYADSAGKPGALLGTTNPITFSSTQAAGWYDLTFPSPVSLTAGNYWIGVLTGTTADVAGYRYDSVSASRDYNSNTYTSGPSNPFGSVTSDNQQTSLYATYTPSAPPASVPENTELPTISGTAQVGQTLSASTGKWSENPTAYEYHWQRCEADGENCTPIEGATNQTYTVAHADLNLTLRVSVTAINADGPSKAAVSAQTGLVQPAPSTATFGKTSVGASSEQFAANRKRVNRYALPTAGSVTKLSIYLAPTGTSGAQVLEGVLYADSAGKPGALLGTTNPITFSSTQAAGWYDLTFPSPVSLTAGNYWIGVLTGTTADVAGYRYDSVSASRDYNSNTYTSGPSNPFGSVTSDNQQTSLYATYTPSAPPASVPENTELPTISGTAQVGQTLSASTGKWSENPTAYEYHWQRCEADGENCTPIEGATNQTYTVAHADLNLTLRVSVTAINADGPSAAAISAPSALVAEGSGIEHLEYVFLEGTIYVYDIDNGFSLVKTFSLPQLAAGTRGMTMVPNSDILYIMYGGDGGANGNGSVLAYNLVTEKVVWTVHLETGIDSGMISPDGKLLYVPTGENSPSGIWNILSTSNGAVVGTIQGGANAHNTVVSKNGQYVYLAGRDYNYLGVYEASTGTVRYVGPLIAGVRPFTVNGSNTLAFTTATEIDGFQVSSITTGKVLFTVSFGPITIELPDSAPSHGISLQPDEKELYVVDSVNKLVRDYDVSRVAEGVAPTQITAIPVAGLAGTTSPCAYDCGRGGWLQRSLNGRYVFVGDSGDVIETATRKVVANLPPLLNTKMSMEIDWANGVPIATSGRSGVGEVE